MALFSFSSVPAFDRLLELQRELDRLFESPFPYDLGLSGRGAYPPLNIFREDQGDIVARLEVPGCDAASLRVETEGQTLRLSGQRETAASKEGSFLRRERGHGEFARSLQLPPDLEPARAEASYRNGVLTVRIPRRAEARPRQITVEAN